VVNESISRYVTHMQRCLIYQCVMISLLLSGCATTGQQISASTVSTVRIATYNTALSRDEAGKLHAALAKGNDKQAKLIAEVLQRTRPDIVLLQEVDYDPTGKAYEDFQRNYLNISQNGAEPITYEHTYAPPVNTGILAPVDLDGDGKITRPNDCFGFGTFEGQYGMVVLSKPRIENRWVDDIRTFREAQWQDKPNRLLPMDYFSFSDEAWQIFRLSSKTHADIPVTIGRQKLHLLVSHPTPPVFDGPEDRNGRRNYDEIGMWADYLTPYDRRPPGTKFPVRDGHAQIGFLQPDKLFLIMGDLNADPNDGESRPGAVQQLLEHERVNASVIPTSEGAVQAAKQQGGKNLSHKSDPAADTADFGEGERGPGNLRVDYVLPSIDLDVVGSGVYWPASDDPHAYLNQASDHKLVWIDIKLP
jgi:endonuclease/exonuclease/phosphatase family metal-dependent hydrolase